MRIIKENENLIAIKDSSTLGCIIGFIFILFGLVILFKPSFININSEIPWLMGIVLCVFGLISILFTNIDIIIFNKIENTFRIQRKNLLTNGRSEQYVLNQIKEIELWTIPNPRSKGFSYKLACVMIDGKSIVLNPTKTSSSTLSIGSLSWNIVPERKIGEKVANFLGVIFNESRRPPTVNETLSTISQSIQEAIKKYPDNGDKVDK